MQIIKTIDLTDISGEKHKFLFSELKKELRSLGYILQIQKINDITLHNRMKDIFLEYYVTEKKDHYYISGKDGRAINNIIQKIQFKIHAADLLCLPDNIVMSWQIILNKIKLADPFVYKNLSLSLIDSQFEQITAKIKASKSNKTDYYLKMAQAFEKMNK